MNNLVKLLTCLLLFGLLYSCNQQPKSAVNNEKQSPDTLQIKDPKQNLVFKQYLNLKNALVESSPEKSQQAAKLLLRYLEENANQPAQKMADSIANTTDLAKQRSTFTNLSKQLITEFRKAKLSKGSFYVQFCPMANEGNGAYWLSEAPEVRNPYYGDEMLNCGEVKETIK